MIVIEQAITIGRPGREVFAFVSSPGNLPRWQTHVRYARTTSPGPLRVGARYRAQTEVKGRFAEAQMSVTAYTPPTHFAVRSISPGPMTVEASYRFQPAGEGTRVQAVLRLHTHGWLRLLQPLLARSARRDTLAYLANLKRLLETRARGR
jgi:uncharacterized membrane protein